MSEPPRYFYDDPLAAAYMHRDFGMDFDVFDLESAEDGNYPPDPADHRYVASGGRFLDTWANPDYGDICTFRDLVELERVRRFYLRPESLTILEPRDGDIILAGNDIDPRETGKIFCRDGKPFFGPKREDTTP